MSGLEQILAEAAPRLHQYGYPALAVAVLVEGAGIPAPGGILMSGAALLAGQGRMSLAGVLATAWIAAVAGDNLGYWIGRAGGRRLLLRAGVSPERLTRFEAFFTRFGPWLLLIGRFFDGPRQLDGLVAGSARMPWPRFFLADLAGSALWVGTWVIGLYALDRHAKTLHRWLEHINPWVAGASLCALVVALYLLLRRNTSAKGAVHGNETAPGPRPSVDAEDADGRRRDTSRRPT